MEAKENINRGRKRMFLDNFLGGIAWGVGSVLGATLFIAILAYSLSKINLVPIIGDFVTEVNQFVKEKESQNPFLQSEEK